MVKTLSKILELGETAAAFNLLDTVSGEYLALKHFKLDKGLVLFFICNHCPFVKAINQRLVSVANLYQARGFQFVAINSNDVEQFPQDSPDQMTHYAQENSYSFPYLYDPDQSVARAYQASCTPEFHLFNQSLQCVYRGQFDSATLDNDLPVTGNRLTAAMDDLLLGRAITEDQLPSVGCSIKWK